jgi:hypothetical protein
LQFKVEQAARATVQATEQGTAIDQTHDLKRALLNDTQQQTQLLPLHTARASQQEFLGLSGLTVQLQ